MDTTGLNYNCNGLLAKLCSSAERSFGVRIWRWFRSQSSARASVQYEEIGKKSQAHAKKIRAPSAVFGRLTHLGIAIRNGMIYDRYTRRVDIGALSMCSILSKSLTFLKDKQKLEKDMVCWIVIGDWTASEAEYHAVFVATSAVWSLQDDPIYQLLEADTDHATRRIRSEVGACDIKEHGLEASLIALWWWSFNYGRTIMRC